MGEATNSSMGPWPRPSLKNPVQLFALPDSEGAITLHVVYMYSAP